MTTRKAATEQGWKLGWSYLPLTGKIPASKGWREWPRETLQQALLYAQNNIGIRTGDPSGGLVVIDLDTEDHGLTFPETVTVLTANGKHLYFHSTATIGNSAGKLAEGVDVRGTGGYVVAVGSIHPDTQEPYIYAPGLDPASVAVAPLPWDIEGKLIKRPATAPPMQTAANATRYALGALHSACDAVHAAREGTRNATLNEQAFALARFVAAGELDRGKMKQRLMQASTQPQSETSKVIDAAIDARLRAGSPETSPLPPSQRPETRPDDTPVALKTTGKPLVLCPGVHHFPDGPDVEVGQDQFARDALSSLPPGALYRMGSLVVEIAGRQGLQEVNVVQGDRMRIIIDTHMRVVRKERMGKKPPFHYRDSFKPCSKDMAGVALAAAVDNDILRDLHLYTRYPVYDKTWRLSKPGWHDGVYYDKPSAIVTAEPQPGTLADLLADFPFRDAIDLENFISLLVTPMIKPAITGNTPMFVIKSSLPRTGKTKLAEQVLGGVYLGEETPAMQWSTSEDERDKRILSVLRQGGTLLHIDNVARYLDSPALASLVTAKKYSGRVLGQSKMITLDNTLTIVATANNPQASGEIVRRTVPITLQPSTDSPELRKDFQHPDLFPFVLSRRPQVLAYVQAMVDRWLQSGKPSLGTVRMGGFESWVAAMSGIMWLSGYKTWMQNWRGWIAEADPEGEDMKSLLAAWWGRFKNKVVPAREIIKIAKELDLFGEILGAQRSQRGELSAFGSNVLVKYTMSPIGQWRIVKSAREYYLEEWKHE